MSKIYGVRFDETGKGYRLKDAEGFRFERSTPSDMGKDDFLIYDAYPFCKLFEYSILYDKEKETYTKSFIPTFPEDTIPNSDICIDFPLFYYSRPSRMEFYVSESEFKDSLPSPMHFRDNHLYKHCYISKYKANKDYRSEPEEEILTDKTINEFRKGFWNVNHSYCQDAAVLFSLNILRLIKYASLDSQRVIGYGWSLSDHSDKTGKSNFNNFIVDGGTADNWYENQHIISLGLEDPWGNVFEFIDGLICHGTDVYYTNSLKKPDIVMNPKTYVYPDIEELEIYKKTNIKCSSDTDQKDETSIISELCYDKEYPELLYPSKSISYCKSECVNNKIFHNGFTDGFWWNREPVIKLALTGGCWVRGNMNGMFHLRLNNGFGIHTPYVGARSFIVTD